MDHDLTVVYSATLADIYLEQGYIEKAMEIYEFLLKREPANETYKRRLEYLRKETGKRTHSIKGIIKKIW